MVKQGTVLQQEIGQIEHEKIGAHLAVIKDKKEDILNTFTPQKETESKLD